MQVNLESESLRGVILNKIFLVLEIGLHEAKLNHICNFSNYASISKVALD